MYVKNCRYGYLPHLKRPFLGGVIILSLSLSSLYAAESKSVPSATTTTKTDANRSGIHSSANSNAIGVSGANNKTTVINKTVIINNYGHQKVVTKAKQPPTKVKPSAKTPVKSVPKKIAPTAKTPLPKVPKTAVATPPKKDDCLSTHARDYCNTTGKLLPKH